MAKLDRRVTEIILLDEKHEEIARHTIDGIVLLALPDAPETARLPKDDKGSIPIISYQIGAPQTVLALLKTLEGILGNSVQKWLNRMKEEKEEKIIVN